MVALATVLGAGLCVAALHEHSRSGAALAAPVGGQRQESAGAVSEFAGASAASARPIVPPDNSPPDELGRIPILMYHSVGDPPLKGRMARFNRLGLSISAQLFRQHLQMLRNAGFYPVNLKDILSPHLDVPRGLSPVVLTFDDARESQFRFRKDGTIDPKCAVGVLAAFHAEHPDWPERATFFVLPRSKFNPTPFGQSRLERRKFAYLVEHGYEIGNHSTSHRPMAHMDAATLAWEMTTCAEYVRRIAPEAPEMETMALPYGLPPARKLLPLLMDDGTGAYHNKCVVLATGGPSYAPSDKRFNCLEVTRVGSAPGYIEGWIRRLKAARAGKISNDLRPYVSDGDPDTLSAPQAALRYLDRDRLGDVRVVVSAAAKKGSATADMAKAGLKTSTAVKS